MANGPPVRVQQYTIGFIFHSATREYSHHPNPFKYAILCAVWLMIKLVYCICFAGRVHTATIDGISGIPVLAYFCVEQYTEKPCLTVHRKTVLNAMPKRKIVYLLMQGCRYFRYTSIPVFRYPWEFMCQTVYLKNRIYQFTKLFVAFFAILYFSYFFIDL